MDLANNENEGGSVIETRVLAVGAGGVTLNMSEEIVQLSSSVEAVKCFLEEGIGY